MYLASHKQTEEIYDVKLLNAKITMHPSTKL